MPLFPRNLDISSRYRGFCQRGFLKLNPSSRALIFFLPLFLFILISNVICFGNEGASLSEFPVLQIRFGFIDPPVVLQKDITVRAPTSNQQIAEEPLECSGMVWFDNHLIILSDRHQHCLFVCPIDLTAPTVGRPEAHPIILNEQNLLDDAESISLKVRPGKPVSLYVMCSMSNSPGALPLPMRQHVLRLELVNIQPFRWVNDMVMSGSIMRELINSHFQAIGVEPYRTYYDQYAGENKNTYRWANIEGLCFVPDSSLAMCGFRNPLLEEAAIVAVFDGFEDAFDAKDSRILSLKDMFTLDLGGRGISDMSWDPVTKGYLIAAAKSNGPWLDKNQPFPPNQLDEALFWWSGRKKEKPILFAQVPDMKIEAICRLGQSRFIAIGSDEGDVSESRARRQTILTIMDFPGSAFSQR
jgi:hypothetical protein